MCTIVTFVLAFGLTIGAVFSIWRFTTHDAADWTKTHEQLTPAYKYFDANRDAKAILAIRMIEGTTAELKVAKCRANVVDGTNVDGYVASAAAGTATKVGLETDWEKMTNLAMWRGTVNGCITDGKVTKGKC